MDEVVRAIDEAFVAHWSLLGRWPGARLVDEQGVLRFETPVPKIPYNGVLRTRIDGDADPVVAGVVSAYAAGGRDFFWVVTPSSRPADLPARLERTGLAAVETATGMALDLAAWEPPPPRAPVPGATVAEVVDEEGLEAYLDVIMSYWELDDAYREPAGRMNRYWSGSNARGHRWVVWLDGAPVGKAYLSVAGPPGVASIYGMSVRPEARGRGIAADLTRTLLAKARSLGCTRVVLHATDMAVGVYRRAGFEARCEFTFYATAPIWSAQE